MFNLFGSWCFMHPTADGSSHSTSQTGHYKNVSNYSELVSDLGTINNYNPPIESILLETLQLKTPIYFAAQKNVETQKVPYLRATGSRFDGFESLDDLVTRSFNSFQLCCSNVTLVKEAHRLVALLRGVRIKALVASSNESEDKKHISVSQQNIDAKLSNFTSLIEVYKGEPLYLPNETNITITALEEYRSSIIPLNKAVKTTFETYEKALDARDLLFYNEETGMIELTKKIKKYVKSLLGYTDPFFVRINGILFETFHR